MKNLPNHFVNDNSKIYESKERVDKFNIFFVSLGPNPVKNISDVLDRDETKINTNNIFLKNMK